MCITPLSGARHEGANKEPDKDIPLNIQQVEALNLAAKRSHMTENAFVCEVLSDRLAVDPLTPVFHEIKFIDEVFQSILGGTNTDTLETAYSPLRMELLLSMTLVGARIITALK